MNHDAAKNFIMETLIGSSIEWDKEITSEEIDESVQKAIDIQKVFARQAYVIVNLPPQKIDREVRDGLINLIFDTLKHLDRAKEHLIATKQVNAKVAEVERARMEAEGNASVH